MIAIEIRTRFKSRPWLTNTMHSYYVQHEKHYSDVLRSSHPFLKCHNMQSRKSVPIYQTFIFNGDIKTHYNLFTLHIHAADSVGCDKMLNSNDNYHVTCPSYSSLKKYYVTWKSHCMQLLRNFIKTVWRFQESACRKTQWQYILDTSNSIQLKNCWKALQ